MGLSSKKTTTTQTNKPIYSREVEGAARSQQQAYDAARPGIDRVSGNMLDLSDDLLGRFRNGDPTINAARRHIQRTLNGDPAENPYLDDMIDISNDNVRNTLQAKLGTRGQTGGSAYYDMIGRGLAQNETGLRFQDYNNVMDRRQQAAGMAPGVVAGDYIPVAGAMQAGQQGAMLPLQAALANSAGVGGLLGQYQNQRGTQTQNTGFMDILGMGLQGASLFSDSRLKTDVRRVGQTDEGATIYVYRYAGAGPYHMGVMAQEIRDTQPGALGPQVGGFMTVDYSEVR